ncbi:MAG TPA: ABC transporter ATP-binding protein [Pirellulales bacterium]|nr:ABC transporter ATP-binding protein [Pirellulales bacterium]
MDDVPFILPALPDAWRRTALEQLETGEVIHAWFTPDLAKPLRYAAGLVLLTDRRILAAEAPSTSAGDEVQGARWSSWSLANVANVRAKERSGLGTLDLLGTDSRLASWRYTNGLARDAHEFVRSFDAVRRGLPLESIESEDGESFAEPAAAPVSTKALWRLARFARQRWSMVLFGFVLTVATTAVGLVPTYLTVPLMGGLRQHYEEFEKITEQPRLTPAMREKALDLLQDHDGPTFGRLVSLCLLGMAGAAVAAWLLGWAQGIVMSRVSERIAGDLRNQTYTHLQKLSLDFFGGKRTGDLIARISSDTDRICNFLADNVVDFASDILLFIGMSCILFSWDPLLAVAGLLPLPLVGWLVYYVRGQLQHGFTRGGRAWSEMTNVLADTIPGIRVVKAFAQEKREVGRFEAANDRVIQANNRVNMVWAFFWPLVLFLNTAGLLVVWAFGAWRVFDFRIEPEYVWGFYLFIMRFYTRLESMSRMFSMTQRAAASSQRIFEILDRVPSVPEPAVPVHPGRIRGEIELRGICFRYGNRQVIENVDLSIEPGEMIGLVGPSGSGKSTLVNLVCRFYDVTQGSILVDGVDVRQFPVSEYRRNIGMVLQDPFLFYGTIFENIAYGRPDATREEVVAAARAAKAHEFIMRLPDGYDSLVGERGQTLSGGERQRISIARAILIDPRILILDEATSSVDTETEREIQEALDNLIQGRTTIAIAHRLSTLRRASRLIVMDRGRIVETGQHQDLVQSPGMYARLHRAQVALAREAIE